MADMLRNYGLDKAFEKEEDFNALASYVIREGKVIEGYNGNPYIFKSFGDAEFWATLLREEGGRFSLECLHTHSANNIVWNLTVIGGCTQPAEQEKTHRLVLCKNTVDGVGMIPVQILNSDVLPCLEEGEKLQLQMIALPTDVRYYEDEGAFMEDVPQDDNGKKWSIAENTMFPSGFMRNHMLSKDGKTPESENYLDAYVQFHAKVKRILWGRFGFDEKKDNTFVRVFADTQFGEIEFNHSLLQISEEDRDHFKVGAIMTGICVLSGDAAIYDYADGVPHDPANNLRALRSVLIRGEANRMRRILAPDVWFETATYQTKYNGPNEVIERFQHVYDHCKAKCYAHYATISDDSASGLDYGPGSRCLVLAYGEPEKYESIVFVDNSDDGMITAIKLYNDPAYRFRLDRDVYPQILDQEDEDGNDMDQDDDSDK